MNRLTVAAILLASAPALYGPASAQLLRLPSSGDTSTAPRAPVRPAERPVAVQPQFSAFELIVTQLATAPSPPAPSFIQDPRFAFETPAKMSTVAVLPGQTLYNLDNPPTKRHWWKYPAYAVLGLPRDLIDGLFGVIGYVPPFNLAFTGAYEYSGAQYLMRHPEDVHEYGGYANQNEHGWINGRKWGFFSNLHRTNFVETDEGELKRRTEHNNQILATLEDQASRRSSHNEEVDQQVSAYFDLACQAYEQGRFEEAVARFWNIKRTQPTEFRAPAWFIASCIRLAGQNSPATPWLRREMASALLEMEAPGLSRLAGLLAAAPGDSAARYWLAWAHARMEAWPEALETSALLAREPQSGPAASHLYFEIAMRRLQLLPAVAEAEPEARDLVRRMQTAVARLRRDAPEDPDTRLAEGRFSVMLGDFEGALLQLRDVAEATGLSRDTYFYGAALVLRGIYGQSYDPAAAEAALTAAWSSAIDPQLREMAAEARDIARNLNPKQPARIPEIAD